MIATVIPTWNEPADRLGAAIESALLVSDLVVVADDGSAEPVAPGMSEAVRVVRQSNKGPAAAMNLGAKEAIACGATILCRLDVGDSFRADSKARQLVTMNPVVASFSPHLNLVTGEVYQPLPRWDRQIYWDGAFCVCSIAVTADVWREVGGFDESLRYGDDWDWTMRVQRVAGWTMYPEVTCEAGAFPGGHTQGADVDSAKRKRKHDDIRRVMERGRILRRAA